DDSLRRRREVSAGELLSGSALLPGRFAVPQARLPLVAPLLREDRRARTVAAALSGGVAAADRSLAAHRRLLAGRRLHRQARGPARRQAAPQRALREGQVLLLPPEL